MSDDEIWQQIIKIHNSTKSLYIFAEEYDPEFSTFIQPNNEIKHAFDHVIRAKSAELGLSDGDVEYSHKNYDKALGHAYRAFFDTADWLSVSLRERVIKQLGPYSNECITKSIPDYYSRHKPKIERVTREIAEIREGKDIGSRETLLERVEKYDFLIQELLGAEKEISNATPSLIEYRRKERASNILNSLGWPLVVGILLIFIGVLAHEKKQPAISPSIPYSTAPVIKAAETNLSALH
jgi:hypothetical protein